MLMHGLIYEWSQRVALPKLQCISEVVSDQLRTARIGVIRDIKGGQHVKAIGIMHVRYIQEIVAMTPPKRMSKAAK